MHARLQVSRSFAKHVPPYAGLLGGRLPNKGGLVAKMEYKGRSLCFVCAHLAAHEGK